MAERSRVHIILFLLFFTSIVSISANKPNVINFYRDKYQAANKNWSIAQDTFGIMYFGNDNGLLEFDGIQWNLYSLPTAKTIRAVAVSHENIIYTGGYEEFGKWERDVTGSLIYTSLSDKLGKNKMDNDDIWKIIITDKFIYFQSFSHIYVYDYQTVTFLNTEKRNLMFLLPVYDEFWVQEIDGRLYRLKNTKLETIEGSEIFSHTEVRTILPFENKQYLVGTSTMGLYVYDGEQFRKWDSPFSQLVAPFELNNGILSKNHHYFFGTILNGAYEVDLSGKIINHFSTHNFLQNNTILSIFEDKSKNIWFALDRGISYIQYSSDLGYYIDPSSKFGAVYSAALYQNKLFLGTNQGLFYIPESDLNGADVFSGLKMIPGSQGQVWDLKVFNDKLFCGHNKGLKIIDKSLTITDSKSVTNGVYYIVPKTINNKGYLLFGTYTSAIILNSDTEIASPIKILDESIISIETDHLGNIWMEHTQKGILRYRFSENKKEVIYLNTYGGNIKNDSLPYNLKLHKLGGRIIFSGNNTFYTFNDIDNKVIVHQELTQQFSTIKNIKKIIPAHDNIYLVVTDKLVYKISYDGSRLHFMDCIDIAYNNLSLVNNYEKAVALNDSISLICLDNGFLLYNTNHSTRTRFHRNPPQMRSITTTDTKSNKKYLSFPGSSNNISYNDNTVIFNFFSENEISSNLYFQFKLEGMDEEWSSPEKKHQATFERLPQGTYTFFLRTIDNLGNVSNPILFKFKISPPWYLSIWAYISYIVLFTLIMLSIWFVLLRRYRNAHLLKVRMREEVRLRKQNQSLMNEIETKNAELFSQTSFIIQKNELIMKVKKEIDDFYHSYSGNKILKPLYTKVESLLTQNMDMEEDWKMFLIQFEQKHTGFFKQMKQMHPDLTPNDLKLCACLKLNLSSKDISSLMNISIRGVENSRYRLRKKLNIPPNQNLNDYFVNI